MPKVFILILHWQNYEITKNCLESFRKLDYPDYQIIVLDNNSTNDSAKKLEKEFLDVQFIFNKENKGYGAGMNPGIRHALENGAEYIFLLNNDVVVSQHDFLKRLISFAEKNKKAGILGPKLIFPNGDYQKSYNNFFLAMALEPLWPSKITKILTKLGFVKSKENKIFKVSWLNAVALLFKREVFEDIGLMDERFFLGAEDVDLSLRARRKGWETWYYPESELIHLSFISHQKNNIAYDKFYVESTVLFLHKHYVLPIALFLRFLMALGFLLRGIEWFLVSIFKKDKLQIAQDFFHMSKLIVTSSY
ncbi:glycosyltransferase family 2 protein [Patescibacteria group bacterium]|nr:glycosyltransferase family 2 protein [Patescibacteria group bacterium]MBU2567617.1 glycosyltransferase family 2 protein [Elusimicrobiota bacterium]